MDDRSRFADDDDESCADARRQFDDKDLVDLTLAIIAIIGWNRLAISFRTPLVPVSRRRTRKATERSRIIAMGQAIGHAIRLDKRVGWYSWSSMADGIVAKESASDTDVRGHLHRCRDGVVHDEIRSGHPDHAELHQVLAMPSLR